MQGLLKVPVTIGFTNMKPATFLPERVKPSTVTIEEAEWLASVENVEQSKMNLKIKCIPINCDDFYFDENWEFTADFFLKIHTKDTGLEFTNQQLDGKKDSIEFTLKIDEMAHLIQKPRVDIAVVIIVKNLKGLKRKRKLDFLNSESIPFYDLKLTFPDGKVAFMHRAIAAFNSPVLLRGSEESKEVLFNYSNEMEHVLNYWYDNDFEINNSNVEKINEIADFFLDVRLIAACKAYLLEDQELSITFLLTVASRNSFIVFREIVEVISSRNSFIEEVKRFKESEIYKNMSSDMKCYLLEMIV